jgi:hypothetical protein
LPNNVSPNKTSDPEESNENKSFIRFISGEANQKIEVNVTDITRKKIIIYLT